MAYCIHCGKPLDEKNPAYLGLFLHKICYQAVGGRVEDLHPAKKSIPLDVSIGDGLPIGQIGVHAGDFSSGKSFFQPTPGVQYVGSPIPLKFEEPDKEPKGFLPPHHTHGSDEADFAAAKLSYPSRQRTPEEEKVQQDLKQFFGDPPTLLGAPVLATPLDTTDMSMNEVLIRLGITKTRLPQSFYDYEYRQADQVIFTGPLSGLWTWLREQKFIL